MKFKPIHDIPESANPTEMTPANNATTLTTGGTDNDNQNSIEQEDIIIHEANLNQSPELVFIDIQLSSTPTSNATERVKVRALHDSGCSKTVLHSKIFDKLNRKSPLEL